MHYIFNSENKLIGYCDFEPNLKDLQSRSEFFVYTEYQIQNPHNLVVGKYGTIWEPAENPITEEDQSEKDKNNLLITRNSILTETDWIVNRHIEQKMLNISTSLSDEDFNRYLDYRQELRDITSNINFPYIELPAPPEINE